MGSVSPNRKPQHTAHVAICNAGVLITPLVRLYMRILDLDKPGAATVHLCSRECVVIHAVSDFGGSPATPASIRQPCNLVYI